MGSAMRAAAEVALTIRPPPCSAMTRPAAAIASATARTLTSSACSQASAVMARNASAGATAAQLTSTSSRPARRTVSATIARRPVGAREIDRDREGGSAAGLGDRLGARRVDVGDRDRPAARRQLPADRGAKAAGRRR